MGCRRPAGFTLLEILVALAVFAVMGVMASQIVSSVLDHQRTLRERGERLADIQRAMLILQRDFIQLQPRPIRDEFGDPQPALVIRPEGLGDRLVEFTRAGWQNPLGVKRSEQQRVAYEVVEETLYRVYWPMLDRAPDTEPVAQELLKDVQRAEFVALDYAGNEVTVWPPVGGLSTPAANLAAVILRLEIEPFGVVERVWNVPAL